MLRGIAVQSYPVREQGPLVWIRMGEQEPAETLPIGDWTAASDWPAIPQYYHLPASYNILLLT